MRLTDGRTGEQNILSDCTNYGSGPGRPVGSSCSICSILATPLSRAMTVLSFAVRRSRVYTLTQWTLHRNVHMRNLSLTT